MFIILYTDLNFYDRRQNLFPVLLKTVQSVFKFFIFRCRESTQWVLTDDKHL